MPLDLFDWADAARGASPVAVPVAVAPCLAQEVRGLRGRVNDLAGRAAEAAVEAAYRDRGLTVVARRWRGKAGEIDLVLSSGRGLVFVEVKKGRDHGGAIARIAPSQVRRICAACEEFLGQWPGGSLTDVRLDAALVDALGRVAIVEQAFAAD